MRSEANGKYWLNLVEQASVVGRIKIKKKQICVWMKLFRHLTTTGLDGTYIIRCVCHYQLAVDSGSLRSMQLAPKQNTSFALHLVIAKSAE